VDSLLGLEGRAALVLGAGQGIGRACALQLARCGARLALVDLEGERVGRVAEEVRQLGRTAEPIVADVTVESQVQEAVRSAVKALGRIDSLVNIIGMASWDYLLDMDAQMWDRDFSLNLRQHFFASRAVARQMIEQGDGGTIAVVASVSGLFAAPRHGAYGAAKAGVMALVRTMAQEWEPHRIRVNAVAPGAVRTPRVQAMRAAGEVREAEPAAAAREALPEDIAGVLLFLSSELARRVNGQTLVVDGGTIARFPFNVG
jgi:NAD(P)-dependent dehydrogenase (short-subunit alcohol dehydrogenase family)